MTDQAPYVPATPLGVAFSHDPEAKRRRWAGRVHPRGLTLYTQAVPITRRTPSGLPRTDPTMRVARRDRARDAHGSRWVLLIHEPLGGWKVRGRANTPPMLQALIRRAHLIGGGQLVYVLDLHPMLSRAYPFDTTTPEETP